MPRRDWTREELIVAFNLYCNKFSFDDHCYHEFGNLRATEGIADDMCTRSISEFLLEVAGEGQRGWKVFDPYDSVGSLNWFSTQRRA